jgi:F-type H+-transporting ATPase subunit b
MINNLFLVFTTEKTGGLFDFDGTLPLIVVQFLVLMNILNFILFTPLTKIIEEREVYVNKILEEASKKLAQANELNDQYNNKLVKISKEINNNISLITKFYKESLEIENKNSQKSIDEFLGKLTYNFDKKRLQILSNLQKEVNILSTQIISKIIS